MHNGYLFLQIKSLFPWFKAWYHMILQKSLYYANLVLNKYFFCKTVANSFSA